MVIEDFLDYLVKLEGVVVGGLFDRWFLDLLSFLQVDLLQRTDYLGWVFYHGLGRFFETYLSV